MQLTLFQSALTVYVVNVNNVAHPDLICASSVLGECNQWHLPASLCISNVFVEDHKLCYLPCFCLCQQCGAEGNSNSGADPALTGASNVWGENVNNGTYSASVHASSVRVNTNNDNHQYLQSPDRVPAVLCHLAVRFRSSNWWLFLLCSMAGRSALEELSDIPPYCVPELRVGFPP